MNENNSTRCVDDKRPEVELDWSEPRFNALGIAETWSVTVEAEGRRVLCISHQHYAGVSEAELDQFEATIRSCAMHLLGFMGANPAISSAVPTVSPAPAAQAPVQNAEEVPSIVREAVEAAFEERDGWRVKIAAAVRSLASKEAAAAEAPSQWISVYDQLPGDQSPLLVTNNITARTSSGGMSHVWLTTMIHKQDDGSFDAFTRPGDRVIEGVSHWCAVAAPKNAQGEKGGDGEP